MTAPAGPLVAGPAAPRSGAPRRWPWPVLSLALHASILAAILLWHVRRPQEAEEAVGVALVFADSETEAPVEGQPGTAVALPPEAPPPVPDQPEQPQPEAVAELPPIPPTPEVERLPRPEVPRPPPQAPLPPRPERTGQRDPEPAPAPPQATPQPTPAAPPPTPPLPQNLPAAPATAELPPPPAPTPVAEQPPAPPQTPVEQPRRRLALPRVYEPDLEEPPTSERWATLPRVIEPDMVEPPPEPEPEPEPPPPPPRPRQRAEPSRPAPPQRQASRSAPASPPAPSGPSIPGPDQPLVLGGGIATGAVVPPSLDPSISNAPPTYPEASRRAGEQGIVGVVITIAPDGSVTAARVAQSSGYTSLDEAALMAVHRWRFRPGTRDGAPVVATIRTAVHFRLQGGGLR